MYAVRVVVRPERYDKAILFTPGPVSASENVMPLYVVGAGIDTAIHVVRKCAP